ncbi:MAG TPA: hypothetical protein VMW76_05320 [Bacteroidales bacterium]|nr:hypothetical protein [Bacteroidales bacterium]
MKSTVYWILAIIITLSAAYYQRKTGPTYAKRLEVQANGTPYDLKLVRSIEIGSGSYVKLAIDDTTISARVYFKRFKTGDPYSFADFKYEEHPINSFIMNKIFKITEEKGFFAELPEQEAAGKLQYYIDITDKSGKSVYFENEPVVIRFKGAVPSIWLTPHIFIMFFAMLLSTLAGLMSVGRHKSYKKYGVWTLILLVIGGMILGPIVQKYAFGALWTGIPFGWDLTDNKTLIAVLFWIIAVYANLKSDKPLLTALAAFVLLLVYSVPHSLFGSELDYGSGEVVQGIILNLHL